MIILIPCLFRSWGSMIDGRSEALRRDVSTYVNYWSVNSNRIILPSDDVSYRRQHNTASTRTQLPIHASKSFPATHYTYTNKKHLTGLHLSAFIAIKRIHYTLYFCYLPLPLVLVKSWPTNEIGVGVEFLELVCWKDVSNMNMSKCCERGQWKNNCGNYI